MNAVLAYLDPGTGSLVLQALVAGFAGLAVAGKYGWRWLWAHFHKPLPALSAEAILLPTRDDAHTAAALVPCGGTFLPNSEQDNQTAAQVGRQ